MPWCHNSCIQFFCKQHWRHVTECKSCETTNDSWVSRTTMIWLDLAIKHNQTHNEILTAKWSAIKLDQTFDHRTQEMQSEQNWKFGLGLIVFDSFRFCLNFLIWFDYWTHSLTAKHNGTPIIQLSLTGFWFSFTWLDTPALLNTVPAANSVPANSAVAKKSSRSVCSVMDWTFGPVPVSSSLQCN